MAKIQEIRKEYVLDQAIQLFLERGIANVTIKDIATQSGLGEASVYRYFGTKQNIVMLSAERLSKQTYELFVLDEAPKTGYEKLEDFFMVFYQVMKTRPELYVYLSSFDAFLMHADEATDVYVDQIRSFKHIFDDAYALGIKDGSVRQVDSESFYYTSTHSILSLCKKLAADGNLLPDDSMHDTLHEVQTLITMILFYINNHKGEDI